MIDERQEENAALYALDLLEGEEFAAFQAELQGSSELRALVVQLRETSARLVHVARPAEPSPFLRERVLASAASAASRPSNRRRGSMQMAWAAAACLGLSSGLLGWQTLRLSREAAEQRHLAATAQAVAEANDREAERGRALVRQTEENLKLTNADLEKLRASLRDERVQSSQIIAALRSQASVADLKIQSLSSLLGDSPKARAIAVWNPLTQEGVLTVANLPALEANKDYQLWLLIPQSSTPVDGGVFRVDPRTGEARVTFKPSQAVPTVDKFAVSLERKGGAATREGPVVLLGQ